MEWLIEKLLSLIPVIADVSADKRELADNALISIPTALNETSIYLSCIRQGLPRDRQAVEQLARYWAAAAVPARHIDEDFAELCLYKSEAWWVNPEEWDSKKIEQYGIDIESVKNKYQAMLLNKPE